MISEEVRAGRYTFGQLGCRDLAVAALQELNHIVHSMNGQSGSSYHLAGLGDLITTATSESSHHHELGRKQAREENDDISGEGPHTLKMINQYQLFNTLTRKTFHLFNWSARLCCIHVMFG